MSEATPLKGVMLNLLLAEEQRGPDLVHALTERSEQGLTVLGQAVAWGFHKTVLRLLSVIRQAMFKQPYLQFLLCCLL
jgi:hypothetical protein